MLVIDNPPVLRVRKRAGRCYELCLDGVFEYPDWSLVHGCVDAPQAVGAIGGRMNHAWMLRDNVVFDQVLNKAFFRTDYSLRFNVEVRAIYTVQQAARLASDRRHWGPWPADSSDDLGPRCRTAMAAV